MSRAIRVKIRVASYRRGGRLTAAKAQGLRAGSVILAPRSMMDWHSTRAREELLIVLRGRLSVEVEPSMRRVRRVPLAAGRCAHLPSWTMHRVVNRGSTNAHYVYVTGASCQPPS
ncbi:MAG: cupin domain-containing protein [Candidatus Omnitrophica bacterium]|nr:cupin domain-containing protein [Candidatus Omnitrophota bacterium]